MLQTLQPAADTLPAHRGKLEQKKAGVCACDILFRLPQRV
jgi:hypothetical protein